MLAVPACGGLGVYLFAGMGHHEHHEQPVRAPTPTDPPLIPPLRSSRRTPPPAHPGRGRKISDSSTLRPPPPFFTPQAYSYMRRRLKQLPWGGDCALFEYGKCQEN